MILVSLITAGYVGLGVRLVDIQVLQHDKHAASGTAVTEMQKNLFTN